MCDNIIVLVDVFYSVILIICDNIIVLINVFYSGILIILIILLC